MTRSRPSRFWILPVFVLSWVTAPELLRSQEIAPSNPPDVPPATRDAIQRLAEGLRLAPIERPAESDRFRLFVADLETGEAVPVVDELERGRARCGSPCWSSDGKRIVFDAAPLDLWQLSRIESLELVGGIPTIKDLGSGRFPCLSRAGDRIAFSLVPRSDRKDAPGVWTMRTDGSAGRWLGKQGRPRWSPDGRRMMVADPGASPPLWMMDASGGEYRSVEVEGQRILSIPDWASADSIIAAIGEQSPTAIVRLDVSDPEHAVVRETLWKKSGDLDDLDPVEVAFSPEARRCVFVGKRPQGLALYTFLVGDHGAPRRVEPSGFDANLGDLALSPGGRYLLFHTDSPARPRGRPSQEPPPPGPGGSPSEEAGKLVQALRRAPILRPKGSDRDRVFLMKLPGGRPVSVLDEPGYRLSFCGSISWSDDGRRIFLDASPVGLFQMAHIKSVELVAGRPVLVEHKPGNCPSLSPDGRQIAYLANSGGDCIEEPGTWVMQADGTAPRYLNVYGGPRWSPSGRKLLISGFGTPLNAQILDPVTGKHRQIRAPGWTLLVAPEWTDDDTLLAVLSSETRHTIALLDVSNPEVARVKEVLWGSPNQTGLTPSDVVYDPRTGLCIFAATRLGEMSLYRFERGKPGSFRKLEQVARAPMIADLALSPDGSYLLYRSNGIDGEAR
ncbi:PD40 domain-containing protein [Aquisphaera insulae]|uniref:PD40 domain-containing protein n=1 Tax=Aquisphaera insulae TaxID=2712864 RepID=UPI0013ECC233|nr:PD40 domain-containing protein [Aquisphaera insulae]